MASDHEGAEQPNKRRRVTGRRKTACQACASRKVRCSNDRPVCMQCQNSGGECIYLGETNDDLTLEQVVEILSSQIQMLTQKVDELSVSNSYQPPDGSHVSDLAPIPMMFETENSFGGDAQSQYVAETYQAARDFAHIPAHRTTADEVLTWPIFENAFPANYLIDYHLGSKIRSGLGEGNTKEESVDIVSISHNVAPLDEQRIPFLVDRFLENVHTKNPILDVEHLVRKAREYASNGLAWDGPSCLLLLACALALVSKPFGSELEALGSDMPIEQARELAAPTRERLQADNCLLQASRRLGSLRPSLLGAQCYFFTGVYLMYTLRPMLSWQYFYQASTNFQLYLKMQGRIAEDNTVIIAEHSGIPRIRQLEQRLFWSAFKSESEFRVELPLPQSEIADYDFPDLFPSPPSPVSADGSTQNGYSVPSSQAEGADLASLHRTKSIEDRDEIKLHAKKLCNEEESWYYYLTEIALRRIGNRVINTFFRHDRHEWMSIERHIDVAIEFEAQVSTWQTNLPPVMQRYEVSSTIRAPRITSPGGAESGYVSRELSWATENRLLEMRHWLYQPFLYYLVHAKPALPQSLQNLGGDLGTLGSPNDSTHQKFWAMIARSIDCNLAILDTRTLPHRHHGLWFDLRNIICASVILLAIVKSGYEILIPGGRATLIGVLMPKPNDDALSNDGRHTNPLTHPIRGKLGRVLRQLEIWSAESPDMIRARDMLVSLTSDILKLS